VKNIRTAPIATPESSAAQKDVIVLAPPREAPSSDVILEDETDNSQRDVVDSCGGWSETSSRVDNGEVDVFEEGIGVTAGDEPGNDG
jgi:hypothetical protein